VDRKPTDPHRSNLPTHQCQQNKQMAHIKMNGSGNISENVENLCMPEDIYRGLGKPSGKPKSWGHLTGFVCCYLAWPNKRSWGAESSRGVLRGTLQPKMDMR